MPTEDDEQTDLFTVLLRRFVRCNVRNRYGMEVAKLVPWKNSLLNEITSVSIEA